MSSMLGTESSFEPVATRRTFEEAVEQIADKIKAGDLHTGDRLPSERDLAAQMRISRPTLREAIKALAEAGVLEVRRGQSGRHLVARVIPRSCWIAAGDRLVSSGVLEARRLLEPRVASCRGPRLRGRLRPDGPTIERQRELGRRRLPTHKTSPTVT